MDHPPPRLGPIVVFDAACVLCSANASYILQHDHAQRFRLASIQGSIGAHLARAHGIDPEDPVSMLVVDGDASWRNDDAVLEIWSHLSGPLPWVARCAFLCPRCIRRSLYLYIARHRYQIFGKRDQCWVPTPSELRRVL